MSGNGVNAIYSYADLLAYERNVDAAVTGRNLEEPYVSRFRERGAHDPTPTPYFVLDGLFGQYRFTERSHLLDVGCGTGRVLAHFLRRRFPGRATGVELDPQLAGFACEWTAPYRQLDVIQGDVLDLDLGQYTDFYLFNPFDQDGLERFIEQVEAQVKGPCTLIHMSDNGDTWHYAQRGGWHELASGAFSYYLNERGYHIKVYDHPQHYTVWRHPSRTA